MRSEGGSPTNVAASPSIPWKARLEGARVMALLGDEGGKHPSSAVEIQAASNQKSGHNSFLKEKEKFNNGFLKG